MKEQMNLLNYIYPNGEKVEISGDLLYALMQVLNQVKESETNQVFTHSYSTKAKATKSKDGLVESVELTTEQYPTAHAFFSQAPQFATTMLGVACQDLLMLIQQIHLEQIENKVALEVGSVQPPKQKENADIKLS